MATSGTVQSKVNLAEIIETGVGAAAAPTVTHTALGASHAITAAKMAQGTLTMDGGAATLDLQAIVGTNGAVVDMSGLKVKYAWLRNTSTNASNITVTFGASNPYYLFGAAFVLVLTPGQEHTLSWGAEGLADVANDASDIDISGTLAQTLDYLVVAA